MTLYVMWSVNAMFKYKYFHCNFVKKVFFKFLIISNNGSVNFF